MSLDEFEKYYREAMSDALNQLQRVMLLSENLEESVEDINTSLQRLNSVTDEFLRLQRQGIGDNTDADS